jgi:hypothetical protein
MAAENIYEMVGGPLEGKTSFSIPIEEAPSIMQFPITEDLKPYKGIGKLAGIVTYEKRLDDVWKYFHVENDLSSEAAEALREQLEAIEVTKKLSAYTCEQLVRELVSRENFVGVIAFALGEIIEDQIPAGTEIAVVPSGFFKGTQGVSKLLQISIDTLQKQNEGSKTKDELKKQEPPVFEIDGIKTLPLYTVMGTAKTDIPQFGKGDMRVEYVDPTYEPPQYQLDLVGDQISGNADAAIKAVKEWRDHISKFVYFVQFKDDESRKLIRALYDHSELVTTLCDTRLNIDPTEIWSTFDSLTGFEGIHSDYRADPHREKKYMEYASRLADAHDRYSVHIRPAWRLVDRIIKQIELKSTDWKDLPWIIYGDRKNLSSLGAINKNFSDNVPLKLFYSYSHSDDELRLELEKHLTMLQRNRVIEGWHFRKIPAGREWEGEIDENLEAAHIILLLISADFLYSNYCWEVEGRRAMERHQKGSCTVIPVILRACEWNETPFHKLQALPTDAKAVTSWQNRDEALTDIAKGIRNAVNAMRRVDQ